MEQVRIGMEAQVHEDIFLLKVSSQDLLMQLARPILKAISENSCSAVS